MVSSAAFHHLRSSLPHSQTKLSDKPVEKPQNGVRTRLHMKLGWPMALSKSVGGKSDWWDRLGQPWAPLARDSWVQAVLVEAGLLTDNPDTPEGSRMPP